MVFEYKKLTKRQVERQNVIREAFEDLASNMCINCSQSDNNSREYLKALEKLEEANMWFNKAISREEDIEDLMNNK